MTYHGSRKQEYKQPNGIRRTELRYSGDIDASGRLKLIRCVGRSFLDKSRKTGGCATVVADSRQDMDQEMVCSVLSGWPDQSA